MRVLFFVFLLYWLPVHAQQSRSITIWTLDETEKPVDNVRVTITGLGEHEISTSSGQCRFTDLPSSIKEGSKINLIIDKEGWTVTDVRSLTVIVPGNPIENPIKIKLKRTINNAIDLIEVVPAEEISEGSSFAFERPSTRIYNFEQEKYSTSILIGVKFRTEDFNRETYLKSLNEVGYSYINNEGIKVNIEMISVDNTIKWLVNLKSKAPLDLSKVLKLKMANRVLYFSLKRVIWKKQKTQSTSGAECFLAQSWANVVLDDPDWISINNARFIKLRNKNESVLEVIIENHTNRAISLTNVQIKASQDWGRNCNDATELNPWQEVKLDWNQIIATNGKEGAWTQINNQDISVKTEFKPASCGDHDHRISIKIPVQMDINPKSTVRLSYKISENSLKSRTMAYHLPTSISDWEKVFISLQPEEFIYPQTVSIQK